MEENTAFTNQLEVALAQKQEWFNSECLPDMLNDYRLLYTCVKNINELLTKKSLIIEDPYKLEKKISEIIVPDMTSFPESEAPTILGERLSAYEIMLDYICTYFRFSVENITIASNKKLLDLNKVFDWNNLSPNNTSSNTRSLAMALTTARQNATPVLLSTINDSLEKCTEAVNSIERKLMELAGFQKELYKGRLRKDLFEHPEFNKQKASLSAEDELAEIKKLYTKVMGKKSFYNDLVQEILNEDHAPNREELRAKILDKLKIVRKEVKKEEKGPDTHELVMQGVLSLSGLAPVIGQLELKLKENFDLLFTEKKGFIQRLKALFRKAFNIKEKERSVEVPIVDAKTGARVMNTVKVNEFLLDLDKKKRIYSSFSVNGPEYNKIKNASEESILGFLNKQISENQKIYTIINSLDEYFKSSIEILLKPRIKGMKIDLSSYRNIIITVNKKRGEYVALKEEIEQMKKLGINKS